MSKADKEMVLNMHKMEIKRNPGAAVIDIAEQTAYASWVGRFLVFQAICEYKCAGSLHSPKKRDWQCVMDKIDDFGGNDIKRIEQVFFFFLEINCQL